MFSWLTVAEACGKSPKLDRMPLGRRFLRTAVTGRVEVLDPALRWHLQTCASATKRWDSVLSSVPRLRRLGRARRGMEICGTEMALWCFLCILIVETDTKIHRYRCMQMHICHCDAVYSYIGLCPVRSFCFAFFTSAEGLGRERGQENSGR